MVFAVCYRGKYLKKLVNSADSMQFFLIKKIEKQKSYSNSKFWRIRQGFSKFGSLAFSKSLNGKYVFQNAISGSSEGVWSSSLDSLSVIRKMFCPLSKSELPTLSEIRERAF